MNRTGIPEVDASPSTPPTPADVVQDDPVAVEIDVPAAAAAVAAVDDGGGG